MQGASRTSGIPAVGDLSWGSHFCQFYQTADDLVETLVPYFSAGLKANESCLWITSEPLEAEAAKDAMLRAVPGFREHIRKGQIQIKDLKEWYVPSERFDADAVLEAWLEREQRSRRDGYSGLRLTGNTFWLERAGWHDFMDYERRINGTFGNYRVLALCTYCLERCTAQDVLDVVANHQFALMRDDGEWKKLEHAALIFERERSAGLQAELNRRNQFLAMLSHELRNPLAPIKNVASLIGTLARDNLELQNASAILNRQVNHLTRLVDDLLNSARVSNGLINLNRRTVELQSVLSAAVEMSTPRIAAKRHRLSISAPTNRIFLDADDTRLVQVFSNLLDNAAKYTDPDGEILLEVKPLGQEVEISVVDNGKGMDPMLLPQLFLPFSQAPTESREPTEGLGLGLALVRHLVTLHAGSVKAASEGAGCGSRFTVRLPVVTLN